MTFTEEQIAFMKAQEIAVDFSGELTDAHVEQIEETISALLQKRGFDATYRLTQIGKMCESILDAIQ